MNGRPSSAESRLNAWLDEGPTSGPDDVLAAAHARARSTRQTPGWWLRLRGRTMETTWRARPMPGMGRLGLALLLTLLIAALVGGALIAAGRLLGGPLLFDARPATAAIPQGDDALFAFTSYNGDPALGDLFVVRADGSDGRRVTADELNDWSPAWSPDGGRIAIYSGDQDSVQLRVIGPDGQAKTVADAPGCWSPTSQPPAWSPDGRFIAYIADRDAADGVCDIVFTDVWVVAADGSGEPHRLFADDVTLYSSDPAWGKTGIAVRGGTAEEGGLYLATTADPAAPWGITPTRVDTLTGVDPVSMGWPQWSPDGSRISATPAIIGQPYGSGTIFPLDGSDATVLWPEAAKDAILPDWSADASWASLLVQHAQLSDHAVYRVAVVPLDGGEARLIDTVDLSGNGGPARISPDGTRLLVRAPMGAMPGDVLVITPEGATKTLIRAGQWSSMDWQPVVNPDNPAKNAPEGLPQF